jgi:hypothetical protein
VPVPFTAAVMGPLTNGWLPALDLAVSSWLFCTGCEVWWQAGAGALCWYCEREGRRAAAPNPMAPYIVANGKQAGDFASWHRTLSPEWTASSS